MAVKSSEYVNHPDIAHGWIDRYATLVKGYTDFDCGCGHPIRVKYRKTFKKADLYEFEIAHRNRVRNYRSGKPDALAIWDRMQKVSTYVACSFPKQPKSSTTYSWTRFI